MMPSAWATFVRELGDTMHRPLAAHQPDVDLGLARAAEMVEMIRAPGGANEYLLTDAVMVQVVACACASGEGRQGIAIGLMLGLQRAIREGSKQ